MDYEVIRNDIVNMKVDAIVLPANPLLEEGNGTSTAIYEKAGRWDLNKACKKIIKRYKRVRVGTAVPTLGFNTDAKYIIHAVTPKWRGGGNNEYEKLSSAYYSSLELADLMDCKSIAIPLLSAGSNGFDIDTAIQVAFDSIKSFDPINSLEKVYLLVYGMRATSKIKQLGINMTEEIDQTYVLGKDEQVKAIGEVIVEHGADIAHKWGDYALDRAMEFINDPHNLDKLVKIGAQIFTKESVDAILKGALDKAVKNLVKK